MSESRPGLAVLANAPAPYHVNLLVRFARGLPDVRLHSLFSHAGTEFDWSIDLPKEVNAVSFAEGHDPVGVKPWRQIGREWRRGGRMIRYVARHDIKAVVCQGYIYLAYLRLIAYCHRKGIPAFLRADSNIRGERIQDPIRRWIKRRLVRWVLRRTAGVMPVGTLGEQYFLSYGADPEKSFLVPLEPDYDAFATVDREGVTAFRQRRGLSTDRRYLLFSGRLAEVKRVDLLVDAFVRIAGERPQWDVVIAGDGELRDSLESRVPESLRPRVIWLGFLQMEELLHAYHAADVLVLPSDFEPWALVVNEAMAAGLPVVASDVVGAAYDLIEDGVSGKVFASGDAAALAEAILDITDSERFAAYSSEVDPKLRRWRHDADPVVGVRTALEAVGVLRES